MSKLLNSEENSEEEEENKKSITKKKKNGIKKKGIKRKALTKTKDRMRMKKDKGDDGEGASNTIVPGFSIYEKTSL